MPELTRNTKVLIIVVTIVVVALGLGLGLGFGLKGGGGSGEPQPYYMATGNNTVPTKTIIWSQNGTSWNSISSDGDSFTGKGRFVAYYPKMRIWLAAGVHTGDATSTLLWSGDGKQWNSTSRGGFNIGSADSNGGYSIAFDDINDIFYATGGSATPTGTIMWSGDGKNWYTIDSGGFSSHGTNIYYDHNARTLLAVGVDSDTNKTVQYSTDGKNWKSGTGDNTFIGVTGGVFVTGKNS